MTSRYYRKVGRAKLKDLAASHGLPVLPTVSTLDMAMRLLSNGREQFLEYVQILCHDKDSPAGAIDAQRWWAVWCTLSNQQRRQVTLDEVCYAAGVSPKSMITSVVSMAFDLQCDLGDLLAALAHPEVVAESIKAAKTPEGVADRRMLLDHAKFLPQPRSVGVLINNRNGSALPEGPPQPVEMPSFADDVRRLSEARSVITRQLESGVKADQVVLGELVEQEKVGVAATGEDED